MVCLEVACREAHCAFCCCRRVFGPGVNFEVTLGQYGEQRTTRTIGGRYYEFLLLRTSTSSDDNTQEPELRVYELQFHGDAERWRLELLDVGADMGCGTWGKELPIRLRHMHSHWLCR